MILDTMKIVLELINETELLMDKDIAEKLFWGIISDTNVGI